jgi:hypothetical protein
MLYLCLIIFLVEGDVLVDSETLLVIDFVNLKIKPTQFFKGAHKDKVYICVYKSEYSYIYIYIYIYTVFKKTTKATY